MRRVTTRERDTCVSYRLSVSSHMQLYMYFPLGKVPVVGSQSPRGTISLIKNLDTQNNFDTQSDGP